ncbi:MAG: hypothetical protein GY786_14125 [Proteobacteria bacterium]|nr:hypothetical protein [Pseudomonadota bacterium]
MNRILTYILLIVFLAQIAYVSWFLPQVVIKGLEFPDDIQLSMIIGGICLGWMYYLKPPVEMKKEDTE